VLVHLPRLHWAGTRSASCIACIVRHRARVSPRLHWAGTRSCIGISCIVPRNGCPDNIGGGRCPAPVLLGAPRQCLADGLRPVARNGWGRHVGAAAEARATAMRTRCGKPRSAGWLEQNAVFANPSRHWEAIANSNAKTTAWIGRRLRGGRFSAPSTARRCSSAHWRNLLSSSCLRTSGRSCPC
jgi:hypothetical protein